MRVKVQKPYGDFSVGHVIPDMAANQARVMIARGLVAEDVAGASELGTDTKAMAAPVDRMMRPNNSVNRRAGKRTNTAPLI